MLDAAAVHDLRALLELLAAGAVEALVVRHEQVVGAPLLDALEQRHHSADVARLGRTDPIVIAAEQPPPVVGERRGHPIDPLARRHTGALRRLNHRLAVLVHSHHEVDLLAAQPPVAGDAVGADLLQGVPQVGIAIGIIDGGGEVELRPPHYNRSCSSATTRVAPSSARSVTRSRKMSTDTTRAFPSAVWIVLPSFGKRLRCCT